MFHNSSESLSTVKAEKRSDIFKLFCSISSSSDQHQFPALPPSLPLYTSCDLKSKIPASLAWSCRGADSPSQRMHSMGVCFADLFLLKTDDVIRADFRCRTFQGLLSGEFFYLGDLKTNIWSQVACCSKNVDIKEEKEQLF